MSAEQNWPERPRDWTCGGCGRNERSPFIPAGWYSLARHTGDMERPRWRLGLFCSAACFELKIEALQHTERDLGPDWFAKVGGASRGYAGHSAGNGRRPRTRVWVAE